MKSLSGANGAVSNVEITMALGLSEGLAIVSKAFDE